MRRDQPNPSELAISFFLAVSAALGAGTVLAQDAIFVDLDGDVGIGDSTPDASLDIELSRHSSV